VKLGFGYEGNLSNALPIIRKLGLEMESKMMEQTDQVNTQKGIVFLIAIALFSAAYQLREGAFDFHKFRTVVQEISKDLLHELESENATSHGLKCVQKYGAEIAGGARAEAYSGFKTVFEFGLPVLMDSNLSSKKQREREVILTTCLLSIMAQNNDTNVLYRSDLESLQQLKDLANDALSKMGTKDYPQSYQKIDEFCMRKRVSPGGTADLLALSLFIYFNISLID
jgi:holo-ACP synthase/triphosphoribosyl-dephospho-CoA synthase